MYIRKQNISHIWFVKDILSGSTEFVLHFVVWPLVQRVHVPNFATICLELWLVEDKEMNASLNQLWGTVTAQTNTWE